MTAQWNQQYSWEGTTWTIVNPLRTQQISHLNKCSTHLQDWCLNKMRFMEWKRLVGKTLHGSICHWLVTKELSIFHARRSTSFRILCCALVRFSETTQLNDTWEQNWDGRNLLQQKLWQNRRQANWIGVEYFPGFNSLQLSEEVKYLLLKLYETDTLEFHRKNHIYDDVQWHFLWIRRQRKIMLGKCQASFLCAQKDLEKDNGHLLSWFWKEVVCISEDSPKRVWDNIAERMLVGFPKSGCPIFLTTTSLSEGNSKAKDMENCRYTMQPIG